MPESCIFCEIIAGRSPASIVYQDERALCFMTLRPTRPGECLVIPRRHVDHFIDLPGDLFGHLAQVAKMVGRGIQQEYEPLRVGLVVHGFGVPHAHLILVPQRSEDDITSARFAAVKDGEAVFRHDRIPELSRDVLDQHAERIRERLASLKEHP